LSQICVVEVLASPPFCLDKLQALVVAAAVASVELLLEAGALEQNQVAEVVSVALRVSAELLRRLRQRPPDRHSVALVIGNARAHSEANSSQRVCRDRHKAAPQAAQITTRPSSPCYRTSLPRSCAWLTICQRYHYYQQRSLRLTSRGQLHLKVL
jgi:hypothetical protein